MVAKKFQHPEGGLNEAGRKFFKRTEGANLKAPTKTTKKGTKDFKVIEAFHRHYLPELIEQEPTLASLNKTLMLMILIS